MDNGWDSEYYETTGEKRSIALCIQERYRECKCVLACVCTRVSTVHILYRHVAVKFQISDSSYTQSGLMLTCSVLQGWNSKPWECKPRHLCWPDPLLFLRSSCFLTTLSNLLPRFAHMASFDACNGKAMLGVFVFCSSHKIKRACDFLFLNVFDYIPITPTWSVNLRKKVCSFTA